MGTIERVSAFSHWGGQGAESRSMGVVAMSGKGWGAIDWTTGIAETDPRLRIEGRGPNTTASSSIL